MGTTQFLMCFLSFTEHYCFMWTLRSCMCNVSTCPIRNPTEGTTNTSDRSDFIQLVFFTQLCVFKLQLLTLSPVSSTCSLGILHGHRCSPVTTGLHSVLCTPLLCSSRNCLGTPLLGFCAPFCSGCCWCSGNCRCYSLCTPLSR